MKCITERGKIKISLDTMVNAHIVVCMRIVFAPGFTVAAELTHIEMRAHTHREVGEKNKVDDGDWSVVKD